MDTIYTVIYIQFKPLQQCHLKQSIHNHVLWRCSFGLTVSNMCFPTTTETETFGLWNFHSTTTQNWWVTSSLHNPVSGNFFFFFFKCSCRLFLATVIYLSSPQLCSSVHHSNTQFLMRYQRWPRGHTAAASGLGPTRAPLTPWFFPHFFNCKRWQDLQSSCHAKWISPEFPIHS